MVPRCLFLLIFLGCETRPESVIKKSPNPTEPTSPGQVAKKETIQPALAGWSLIPTSRVAVGKSIWLESVKSPEESLVSMASEALAGLGGAMNPSYALQGSLPRQPVISWQKRIPGNRRRVIVELEVVLRQGFLEHLFSRAEAAKDHESLLSAPFDAEILHAALLGAGLQPGKPAKFINEKREYDYKPATGDVVKIYFEYVNEAGKSIVAPAQSWVVQARDSKPLNLDWVFAGSFKGKSTTAEGKEFIYFGANDGRVVCLTNFSTALLDLPIESIDADPNSDALGYRANTDLIPERGTKVRAILEAKPPAP